VLTAVTPIEAISLGLAFPVVVVWIAFAIRSYDEDDPSGVVVVAAYGAIATLLTIFSALQVAAGNGWFVVVQSAILSVGCLVWCWRRAIDSHLSDRTRSVLRWIKEPWGI
jgi:hypothetical protein